MQLQLPQVYSGSSYLCPLIMRNLANVNPFFQAIILNITSGLNKAHLLLIKHTHPHIIPKNPRLSCVSTRQPDLHSEHRLYCFPCFFEQATLIIGTCANSSIALCFSNNNFHYSVSDDIRYQVPGFLISNNIINSVRTVGGTPLCSVILIRDIFWIRRPFWLSTMALVCG